MGLLITGVNGFVGNHLAKVCLEKKYSVIGVGFGELSPDSPLKSSLKKYIPCDLTNKDAVDEKIDLTDVKTVFHLAGLAAVGPSFRQPVRYIKDNSAMLVNVAERALTQNIRPRLIVVSSGSVYDPAQPLPIDEEGKLLSSSPYSVSKITVELLCDYYKQRGLDMIIVRPFNHIGPGQGPGFILPDLADQAKKYSKTNRFMVGNLKTKRDYTDVRDVVRAYIALAETPLLKHSVYNVCSGKSYSGEYVLEKICEKNHITSPIVKIDQSKIRPSEIMEIQGSNARLNNDTGWTPQISIDQSVEDFLKSSL